MFQENIKQNKISIKKKSIFKINDPGILSVDSKNLLKTEEAQRQIKFLKRLGVMNYEMD